MSDKTSVIVTAALAASFAAVTGLFDGARPAHAEVVYELSPMVSVGATDNALQTAMPLADEFGSLSLSARVRYVRARQSFALGYRLIMTRFLENHGADTVTHEASGISTFNLSATLDLTVGANLAVSRASRIDFGEVANVMQQAAVTGPSRYLTTGGLASLAYTPSPRRRVSDTLSVTRLQYLESTLLIPTSTFVSNTLRGEILAARDTYSLDVRLTDFFADTVMAPIDPNTMMPVPSSRGAFSQGHNLLLQIWAGWRREFSAVWSAEAQAGPLLMFNLDGDAILAPSGMASVGYRRQFWYATLTATQAPSPNLLLAAVTINDQIFARLALPLTRDEMIVLAGFGGYVYARLANDLVDLTRLYDQFVGGAVLSVRFARLPFWAALEYSFIDQRGSSGVAGEIPDLLRRTVMVNITGAFVFGPGTPPLFGGGL